MATVKNVIINVKSNTKGIKNLQTEFDKLTKDNKELAKQYKKTNAQLQKSMNKSTTEAKTMSNVFNNLGLAITGAFVVTSAIQFGKSVFNVTAEFQKLEAVLTNTLGSKSEAQLALAQIQKFASETPFSVLELTDSFIKLTNQGFKPTMNEMTKLGDLASSTGKSFDMLAEAIIDGQVGEFERLKEFGIRASKQGDIVAFTFKGVTTEVARTEQAMRDYIVSLGDVEGVSGAMEAISQTLTGQLSNLGDAWDSLLVSIGNDANGVFAGALAQLAGLVKGMEELVLGFDGMAEKQKLVFGAEIQKEIIGYIEKFTSAGAKQSDVIQTQIENLERQRILEENALILSKNKIESMSTLEHATDFAMNQQGMQIDIERRVQASAQGHIDAIDELIIKLKDQAFVTEELNKLKEAMAKEGGKENEAITDLILIQKELLKQAKEMDGSTEANLILRRQKIESINKEIKRLQELTTQKEKQLALDEKIHDIEVKGMHDRTKTMMEADKAQDEFNQTQRETARLLKINSIELMNVADAQMVYGKGFEDLAPKTQEQIDLQQTLVSTGIEGFALLANTTVELWQQQLQKQANAEMKYINDKLQRGEISDKEFERRRKAIARRQFEQQKEASMYQVIIAGAVASANVWAQYAGTPPIALALQALVVAETASQLALIANQPIPEFEKGGEIGGKRHRDGGTIIEAERGEFMVNRIAYANNKDVVNAINDGKFDKYIHEHYVLPSLKLGSIHSHDNKSLAENIAKSILLQSKLDDQRIVGHLKMNNDTSKDNTLALINALGNGRKDLRNV